MQVRLHSRRFLAGFRPTPWDGLAFALIFGLLLVIMMRFRPEGLVPNQRRQLEFHDDDEELVERIEDEIEETGLVKGGGAA